MKYVSITLMILIVLVILYIIHSGNDRGLQEWNDTRPPFKRADFINHFTSQGYDEDIVIYFYDSVMRYIGIENCNLCPQDRLTEVWQIDSEDLEFGIIPDIFKALSISLPSDKEIEQYRTKHQDIVWDTPEFLIGILQELRNKKWKSVAFL